MLPNIRCGATVSHCLACFLCFPALCGVHKIKPIIRPINLHPKCADITGYMSHLTVICDYQKNKEVLTMTIKFNVPGKERKRMVLTIAKWLGEEVKYKGAPSFAYEVDYFTIDKDGNLIFDDRADSEVIERLLEHLYDEGFESDISAEAEEPTGVCISMPKSLFTDANLENLKSIVAAKGNLIRKALGAEELPIEVTETKVSFPWFPGMPTPEELKAYDTFICKLCEMARNQKRVNAKEKDVDNEKYAFRCFLLRLGFIGDEFKTERKILLHNLSGSSAFKSGKPNEQEVYE
nr:MAG TPA: Putative amidoligase enzyme [Caudoviricetes sp.]